MMRHDLEAGRSNWISEAENEEDREQRETSDFLAYQDDDGLFADFHAHTFISNLGKAGVPLTMAQKLARHCDPKLTANIYTHLEVSDQAKAIESLPSLPETQPNTEKGQQSLRATGTDDACPSRSYGKEKGQHLGQQSGGELGQKVAKGGETGTSSTGETGKRQVLTLARDETSRRVVANAGRSGDERARTANPRLAKPVLSQLSYVPSRVFVLELPICDLG